MKANFETGSKFCPKCKQEKELSNFSKDKTTSDGLQSRCKECRKPENRESYLFYNPQEIKYCNCCGSLIGLAHGLVKYCESCRVMIDNKKKRDYQRKRRITHNSYINARLRVWRRKNKNKVKTISEKKIVKKEKSPININEKLNIIWSNLKVANGN